MFEPRYGLDVLLRGVGVKAIVALEHVTIFLPLVFT